MQKLFFKKFNFKYILLITLLIFLLVSSILILQTASQFNSDNHLVLLAEQFSKGHISLTPDESLPLGDISKFNGKFYLYFAPLPSILLVPFVLMWGSVFPQVLIGVSALIGSLMLSYMLAKSFTFSSTDSVFLSLFFVYSTPFFAAGLINITAFQVEALGVFFVLFALFEYFTKKRSLIIGISLGLAFLTRSLLILSLLFFLIETYKGHLPKRQLLSLIIPVLVSIICMGIYNFARFQNFFDTGISYSITLFTYPLSLNLEHGITSISHIPGNLYALLFMPPVPILENPDGFFLKFPYLKANPWGMAVWFTSPLLILLFTRFKKNKYTFSLLTTIIIILIPILTFYSIGFTQYGYRYILDILPFLFVLTLFSFKPNLGKLEIALITLGVVFNSIMVSSLWGVYPHFGIHL